MILLAVAVSTFDVCWAQSSLCPPPDPWGMLSKEEMILHDRLHEIGLGVSAEIGVSFGCDDCDFAAYYEAGQFPLLSVMKFHQALAVCNELEKTGRALGDSIKVRRKDLRKDTWSPMREKYPKGGMFTIRELLWYSLVQSDNNACDILSDNVVSISKTQDFVDSLIQFRKALEIFDSLMPNTCRIAVDEKTMGQDMMRCYDNCTVPGLETSLMRWFYRMKDEPLYSEVWQMMAECETGRNRIPRYLGDDVVVFHKTGTGPMFDGKIIAVNDVACILLPDGQYFFLAVFMRDARIERCPMEKCEETIAQIAKLCMEYVKEKLRKNHSAGDIEK